MPTVSHLRLERQVSMVDGLLNIGLLPARGAALHGSRPAVTSGGETATFHQLNEWSSAFAADLIDRGVKVGERVCLFAPSGMHWAVAYYGVLKAGGVLVPVNPRRAGLELDRVLADCAARWCIADMATVGQTDLADVVLIPLTGDYRAAEAGSSRATPKPPGREPRDDGVICYTSGATRPPVGVRLSHRSVVLSAAMLALMHGRCAEDVVLNPLHCANVYGAAILNSALLSGAHVILVETFVPERVLSLMERERVSLMDGVPTMYAALIDAMSGFDADLSSLRLCAMGGAAVPIEHIHEIERGFGCPVAELWGMTEVGGVAITHPSTGPRRPGAVGFPVPFVDARLFAAEGNAIEVVEGEIGELAVRGPMLMTGYLSPAGEQVELAEGAWFRTGDLMRKGADAAFEFVERKADVIITSAGTVYPAEVERVVQAAPGVTIAAVALNDKVDGLDLHVVMAPGSQVGEGELLAYCRMRLPKKSWPQKVIFRDFLPMTSTGKVIRRDLGAD